MAKKIAVPTEAKVLKLPTPATAEEKQELADSKARASELQQRKDARVQSAFDSFTGFLAEEGLQLEASAPISEIYNLIAQALQNKEIHRAAFPIRIVPIPPQQEPAE